jgi:type II secretory pathway component PulK
VRKSNKAYILVEALIAVAGLLALMAILVSDQQQSIDQVQNNLRLVRAEACADAAVQQALAVLATANAGLVTNNDSWAQLGGATTTSSGTITAGTAGTTEYDFPDGTSFREQVIDASSLINLNTTTQQQLQLLPLDPDQVDSFLDWIQPGDDARSDGAKDAFYNDLPVPYNAKLGPLTTVNELLLIDNWTGQTLFQAPLDSTTLPLGTDYSGNVLPLATLFTVDSGSPNTTTTGTALINLSGGVSAATGRQLLALGVSRLIVNRLTSTGRGATPVTSWNALFALPGVNETQAQILLNSVTFSTGTRSTGKINVNTATLPVLESIPLVTATLANSIVQQQSSTFQGLGALATTSGLSPRALASVVNNFTVGSDTWIVRAYGVSGGIGSAEEAVVGYRNSQLQIISVNRIHTGGIPAWWAWDPTAATIDQVGVTQ